MGQKILLRLRPAWAPDTFYPEEDIVHTMLHEVTFLIAAYLPLDVDHTSFHSSHTMYMDRMIRTFTISCLV